LFELYVYECGGYGRKDLFGLCWSSFGNYLLEGLRGWVGGSGEESGKKDRVEE